MNQLIYTSLFLGLMLTLFSCEGGTTFTNDVENRTTETIEITTYVNLGSSQSFTIEPNTTENIYTDDITGLFVGEVYDCVAQFDSILVSVGNNKMLVKDIMNHDNWDRVSKDGRNSREDCTFVINDGDLQ